MNNHEMASTNIIFSVGCVNYTKKIDSVCTHNQKFLSDTETTSKCKENKENQKTKWSLGVIEFMCGSRGCRGMFQWTSCLIGAFIYQVW